MLRVKRDILRRSTIGAIFTNRSIGASAALPGSNQAYGVDGAFSFYQNVAAGAYYARTDTEGLDGDNESYQARAEWVPTATASAASSPRSAPPSIPRSASCGGPTSRRVSCRCASVRGPGTSSRCASSPSRERSTYFVNGNGAVETRTQNVRFNTEFESSDQVTVEATDNYEALFVPFNVGGGVFIPAGGYNFRDATVSYAIGQQRRFSGTIALQAGEFYDGTLTALTLSTARYAILKQFSVEPSVSINRIDLPYGEFTTQLYRARSDYAFSPRMFLSALLQYGSADNTFSSNIRYRWEYIPGSELLPGLDRRARHPPERHRTRATGPS